VGVYYHFRTLLSGTILLNDTPGCRLVLERWAALCQSRRRWDQSLLADTLRELGRSVSIDRLPPQYTFVFDRMRGHYRGLVPVIEHLQASRDGQ
jgi:hypothetical protein